MQDQGHSRTHRAQDLATRLLPTAQHLLFARGGAQERCTALRCPMSQTTAPWA